MLLLTGKPGLKLVQRMGLSSLAYTYLKHHHHHTSTLQASLLVLVLDIADPDPVALGGARHVAVHQLIHLLQVQYTSSFLCDILFCKFLFLISWLEKSPSSPNAVLLSIPPVQ